MNQFLPARRRVTPSHHRLEQQPHVIRLSGLFFGLRVGRISIGLGNLFGFRSLCHLLARRFNMTTGSICRSSKVSH